MRPVRRRPGPWVGMVSLLAPTDRSGWEVRSWEPSLWGLFFPPPPPGGSRGPRSWRQVSGARVPYPPCSPPPGAPGRRAFGCLGPAPPAAIWECRGGRNMAPSRGQCTREPRLHLLRAPGAGQSHLRPSCRHLRPQIQRRPWLGQGPLTLFPSLYPRFGGSDPFNLLTCFFWH